MADTDGYIQAANGGTLFLDEIAELHPTVQAKLLRVLESREVLALGAVRPQPVNIRVCSASHRSLEAEVAAGRLREDLYYWIGRPAERVSSLRERPEEIPWLIDGECQKIDSGLGIHVSLVEACMLRHWPGNIRELLVEIRSAAQEALATGSKRIRAEHLSPSAGLAIKTQSAAAALPVPGAAESTASQPPAESQGAKIEVLRPSRAQIVAAILEARGNVSEAARSLAVHRTQLRRDIAYHGIDVKQLRELGKR